MGDPLRSGKRKRAKDTRRTTHGEWRDGAVCGRLLVLEGNRVVLVAWHHYTLMAMGSWCMSSWDYATLRQEWEEDPMARFLKAATAKPVEKDAPIAAADKEFAKLYPALCEYLTVVRLDDGTTRRTSSLLLFCEDGSFKLCLSDRENERTLWASAGTHDEALEALEAILQSPNPQWRTQGKRTSKK